jgi:hypothetical protein
MRSQISSDIHILNNLNDTFKWIPNEYEIRPNFQTLSKKYDFMDMISVEWNSLNDCLLHLVFGNDYFIYQGKKFALDNNISSKRSFVLQKSMFPYRQIENGFHYVLWFSSNEPVSNNVVQDILESEINTSINFAWYINPKPSVLDFWHVQVFTDKEI